MSELKDDLDRFERIANQFMDSLKTQGTTNTQTTTIDTGNKFLWLAVWIATSCCIAMFFMVQDDRDQIAQMRDKNLENSRKLEADSDRLSILLQWAPNLRDEVNKEMKDKEKSK